MGNGWGEDVAFLAELCEGEKVLVKTDESWITTNEGPLRDTDNMNGEIYDARKEQAIWGSNDKEHAASGTQADTNGSDIWHPVTAADFGYGNLVFCSCPPPTEHETFTARMLITPKGENVLDFGQNIAGYISFEMDAEEGEHFEFIHGETLDGDGNFCNENFQSQNYYAAQRIDYTCREGRNVYKAANTFMGFRYVLIRADRVLSPECFKAHAVYTDLKVTADFKCGNELVNRLVQD